MSRLTDKAKAFSFLDAGESAPPSLAAERPRTAIGAISASLAMGRGIEAENRDLKAKLQKFEDATIVEFLDPKLIRPSRYANRHELSFGSEDFVHLKEEIASAGRNVQPIKVRRAAGSEGEPDSYEIAYGHRRHRACLELGIPVAAIVDNLTDAQLFAEMDRENRERQNLSPWEQGVMYKRALDNKLFPSLRALADAIGAQPGNVSTAIQLAALPSEVVGAFSSPLNLQFRWAPVLKAALERDSGGVIARARELTGLGDSRPDAKEVFGRLVGGSGTPQKDEREPLLAAGKQVGEWVRSSRGVTVKFGAGVLSEAQQKRLRKLIGDLLGA